MQVIKLRNSVAQSKSNSSVNTSNTSSEYPTLSHYEIHKFFKHAGIYWTWISMTDYCYDTILTLSFAVISSFNFSNVLQHLNATLECDMYFSLDRKHEIPLLVHHDAILTVNIHRKFNSMTAPMMIVHAGLWYLCPHALNDG